MTAFAFLYPMMFLLVSSYLGEFVESRAIRRQELNPSRQKPNSRRRLSATTSEGHVLRHSEHLVKSLEKTNGHLSGLEAGLKRDINILFEMRCNAWVADAIVPITENETNKRNSKYGALDMKVNHALKSLEASGASQQERIDLLTRGIAQLKKDIRRKIRPMVKGNKWIKKARKVNTKAEQKSGSSNPLTLHDSVGVQTDQAQPLILNSLAIKAPTETSENTNCQSSEASGIIENSGNTQRPTVSTPSPRASTPSPRASTPSPTPQQPQALRLYSSAVKAPTEKSRDTNCQSSEVSGITWSSENTQRPTGKQKQKNKGIVSTASPRAFAPPPRAPTTSNHLSGTNWLDRETKQKQKNKGIVSTASPRVFAPPPRAPTTSNDFSGTYSLDRETKQKQKNKGIVSTASPRAFAPPSRAFAPPPRAPTTSNDFSGTYWLDRETKQKQKKKGIVSTASRKGSKQSLAPQRLKADTSAVQAPTEKSENTNCQSSEASGITWSSENTLSPTVSTPSSTLQRLPPQLLGADTSAVTCPTKESHTPTGQSLIIGNNPEKKKESQISLLSGSTKGLSGKNTKRTTLPHRAKVRRKTRRKSMPNSFANEASSYTTSWWYGNWLRPLCNAFSKRIGITND